MTPEGFIKKEAAKRLNINPSKIQYYTDQGIIIPEISAPKGRGTRRIYSKRNLLEILIAERLVQNGMAIRHLISIMWMFKGTEDIPPGGLREKFWSIDGWDFTHSVFLTHAHEFETQHSCGLLFLKNTEKNLDLSNEVTKDTKSLLMINITDLLERVAKI